MHFAPVIELSKVPCATFVSANFVQLVLLVHHIHSLGITIRVVLYSWISISCSTLQKLVCSEIVVAIAFLKTNG